MPTANIASDLTMDHAGTDEDGNALYHPVPGHSPGGHCYLNADGLVVVPAGENVDMRADDESLTADSITDEQIWVLLHEAGGAGDEKQIDLCREALRPCAPDDVSTWKRDARAACARAINSARAQSD